MEDKLLGLLATQLKTEPGVLKEAFSNDANAESFFDEWNNKHKVFTTAELAKFTENSNREYIEKLGTDGKPLPSNIYNLAKGNAFEKKEKAWAKDYGIESWDDIDDLLDKIVRKKLEESGKATTEKDSKIEELKGLLKKADKEKEEAIAKEKGKFHNEYVGMRIETGAKKINIDAEGEALENQRNILKTMFMKEHSFTVNDDWKIVVLKDGNVIKDKVGDPLPFDDVFENFAPKYVKVKDVPSGGRGGSSTDKKTDKGFENVTSLDTLVEYAKKSGIEPGTEKFYELMVELKTKKPDIKL
jgi:uncharacterized protein YdaU (DUF1376 family)